MRNVLFILPNGAKLMRRNLRSKQVYSVGAVFKTSKGYMEVIKSNVDNPSEVARDGHETVEIRYHVPPQTPIVPICFPGGTKPTIA